MSVTSGFFNSLNGDRKYNATSISKIFDGLINDGIYMSVGNAFLVNASSGMNVIVKPGRAWFNHTWTLNDSDLLLTIDPSELLMSRIDAVVLEVDNTDEVRGNTIKIVKGAPAEVALKPALTNTEDVHQYALAYITVDPKVTTIDQAKIENVVGTKDTPYVNAIVQTIDTSEMYAQFTAQFNAWFENIQDSVSDNAVLDLAMKIADLTKTDNSVPTLLYRYVLFPETLSEAEKLTIESNTDLMTLVRNYKRGTVEIGSIIFSDTRKIAPPEGYLRCTGGVIQAADFPEYAKKLTKWRYALKRMGAGGWAAMPWYYRDGTVYYQFIGDRCTYKGYTVAFVGSTSSSTPATATSYYDGRCMIFNPKGEIIYNDKFGFATLYMSGNFSTNDTNYEWAGCKGGAHIHFEDDNTVYIACGYSDGSNVGNAFVKLSIYGDTVTVTSVTKVPSKYTYRDAVNAHIFNTNSFVVNLNNRYTSQSDTSQSGQSNSHYCSHYKIVDEVTGSGAWKQNVVGTQTETDPEVWSLRRSDRDLFPPNSNQLKFTTAGIFLTHVYGYTKINYGETTGTTTKTTYKWGKDNVPEGHLLDICAKKGDWIPCENAQYLYNIKTGQIKSTNPYGMFIGTMVFDERSLDLYINASSSYTYLNGLDSETEEVVIDQLNLRQYMSSYAYKANATNMSAKNFILIGHKLFIYYPLVYTASTDYISYNEQYKEYYEISLDQIQLPKPSISDDVNASEPLIRVK